MESYKPIYHSGMYTGIGFGLVIAAIVFSIRIRVLLGNEEKLKEEKIRCTDERNVANSTKAFRVAGGALIIVMYIVAIIAGAWNHTVVMMMLGFVFFFVIVYLIAFKILDQKE